MTIILSETKLMIFIVWQSVWSCQIEVINTQLGFKICLKISYFCSEILLSPKFNVFAEYYAFETNEISFNFSKCVETLHTVLVTLIDLRRGARKQNVHSYLDSLLGGGVWPPET